MITDCGYWCLRVISHPPFSGSKRMVQWIIFCRWCQCLSSLQLLWHCWLDDGWHWHLAFKMPASVISQRFSFGDPAQLVVTVEDPSYTKIENNGSSSSSRNSVVNGNGLSMVVVFTHRFMLTCGCLWQWGGWTRIWWCASHAARIEFFFSKQFLFVTVKVCCEYVESCNLSPVVGGLQALSILLSLEL